MPPSSRRAASGLRLDSGVEDGSVVGVHYDPMLAKVIAWAPTRAEATRLLADALARAELHGVTTNRDLLVRVLRHPEFLAGEIDTAFLDRHPRSSRRCSPTARLRARGAGRGAGRRARRAGRRHRCSARCPSGWRNVPPPRR